ncbi:hypothetical protein AV530_004884 [Patagioenas fasciata monilis]|uniref:Uncharacterized protein n=1 Tax=Patagioenas fasciata monilis TaxID=372326 RepID=A0A1V4JTU4_PATFA|nr:hypothetical protein AV530_004884 [Patagioenas fasciata monilis]
MIKQRAKQELPGRLGVPMAEEKTKYNSAVSEVTIVNLQPEKNPTLILPGRKPGSEHRNLGFHPPSPRISEKRLSQGEKKLWPEKAKKETALSPSLHRANEFGSTENVTLKRPVRLAPLEIPVEVKEAQLQKIMSIQREAQMAAQKLSVINSISNEPHVKRVKNLAQGELENLQKTKLSEKTALENKDDLLPLKSSKPLGEIQIVLPPETTSKLTKQPGVEEAPKTLRKPLIPTLQVSDMHEESNSPDSIPDPCQNVSRRRFRVMHTKEQQEDHGKAKPLKVMDPSMGEGKQKSAGQRTQKTLSDASKLIENVAKKQKERGAKQGEMDEASFARRQSIRRMALGDIIQVDED